MLLVCRLFARRGSSDVMSVFTGRVADVLASEMDIDVMPYQNFLRDLHAGEIL